LILLREPCGGDNVNRNMSQEHRNEKGQ
jgi:hypothetical protein